MATDERRGACKVEAGAVCQPWILAGERIFVAMRRWKLATPVKMKDDCAQTVLLVWKSVRLVCDAVVKLNKFLFADSKLRCVADCLLRQSCRRDPV
jgi:hypothetical protein